MKRSAGLVVLADIPRSDGRPIICAILQRRGTWNFEKMRPETFPGCLQVTSHGGLEDGEDFNHGLNREAVEELGEAFVSYVGDKVTEILRFKNEEQEVVTFTSRADGSWLKEIRLEPGSGGLQLVRKDQLELLIPTSPEMRIFGAKSGVWAMFPDEIEAVKKAFEVLG